MINWPYLHTVINHIPIVLTVVGALSVFLGLVHTRRGVWLYGLTSLTLAGVTIYPAWLTGRRAAGFVRNSWYIQREVVHTHSAAADITLWVILATGLFALLAWITVVRARDALSPARWLRIIMGITSLVALVAVSYTSYLGGKVVVESAILMSPTPPLAVPPVTAQPAQPGSTVTPGSPAGPAPAPGITPSTPAPPTAPASGMPVPAPIQPPPSAPAPATP